MRFLTIFVFLNIALFTACSVEEMSIVKQVDRSEFLSLISFYSQELVWDNCKDYKKFECAEIQVPVDYKNPGDASLTLALNKLPAKQS